VHVAMPLTTDDVREAVLSSASENSNLLVKLANTEEAPGNFALHVKHISRLRDDLQEQEQALKQLTAELETKFRSHKKFNDNATWKFFYRASFMGQKLEARAMKAEQEYFAALAMRSKTEERRARLQHDLEDAETKEPGLLEKAQEHGEIHGKIDGLYETLFAGPTPGFDREDSLENRFYAARGNHETVKSKIVTARRAARHLKIALNRVKKASRLLDVATVEAANSYFLFDEALYSLSQCSKDLEYAKSALLQANQVLEPKSIESETAKRLAVQALQQFKIPSKIASNREAFRVVIKTAQEHIEHIMATLQSFLELTKRMETEGLEEIKKTARTLEDVRQALHQSRMGIFEEVAGFGQAAPAYTECCDRAEAFCELPQPHAEEIEDNEEEPTSPSVPDYNEGTEATREGEPEIQHGALALNQSYTQDTERKG
jgi:hypothetical protein